MRFIKVYFEEFLTKFIVKYMLYIEVFYIIDASLGEVLHGFKRYTCKVANIKPIKAIINSLYINTRVRWFCDVIDDNLPFSRSICRYYPETWFNSIQKDENGSIIFINGELLRKMELTHKAQWSFSSDIKESTYMYMIIKAITIAYIYVKLIKLSACYTLITVILGIFIYLPCYILYFFYAKYFICNYVWLYNNLYTYIHKYIFWWLVDTEVKNNERDIYSSKWWYYRCIFSYFILFLLNALILVPSTLAFFIIYNYIKFYNTWNTFSISKLVINVFKGVAKVVVIRLLLGFPLIVLKVNTQIVIRLDNLFITTLFSDEYIININNGPLVDFMCLFSNLPLTILRHLILIPNNIIVAHPPTYSKLIFKEGHKVSYIPKTRAINDRADMHHKYLFEGVKPL